MTAQLGACTQRKIDYHAGLLAQAGFPRLHDSLLSNTHVARSLASSLQCDHRSPEIQFFNVP